MVNTYSILKNSAYLLCSIFLLNSCTTPEERAQKVQESVHKVYIVEIRQMQFKPAELTLQKGDTVVWTNQDIVTHDVTEEKHKLWTSGPLAPGHSWSFVVMESADYYCSIHVVMKGKLIVN